MTTLFKVSQSKVKAWRHCRRQYQYKHIEKIQRRRRPRPFAFGTLIHKMKERLSQGGSPFEVLRELPAQDVRLFKEEREYYGDIITDCKYVMQAYLDYWKDSPLIYLKRNSRTAEFPFELKYPKEDILIKGTIDAATSHRKMTWLTEHKNHGKIPNDDERWRSIQSAVYIAVSDLLGWWSFEGTCWDYIRSKPPSRPKLLKSGEISERQLDSLPQVVIDEIKNKKLNPRDYTKLIDQQRQNMSTWFQRVYTPIKKKVINNLWNDFITTSVEMRDTNMDKPQPRTIGRHCSWCEFELLCRASLQGLDEEFVKETQYEASTYGDEDKPAERDTD